MKLPWKTRVGKHPEMVTNPISGASIELTPEAAAVYYVTIGAEMLQQWQTVREGLAWFREYFPKEYMILLD